MKVYIHKGRKRYRVVCLLCNKRSYTTDKETAQMANWVCHKCAKKLKKKYLNAKANTEQVLPGHNDEVLPLELKRKPEFNESQDYTITVVILLLIILGLYTAWWLGYF